MKLFRTIFLLLTLCISSLLSAQNTKHLSLELGGSGGFGSFNYETRFKSLENVDLDLRAGISFSPIDKNNGTVITFPVMVHATAGSENHKADIGLGQAFSVTTKGSFFILMPASFGYRFVPSGKRHYWRVAYTPIISYLLDFQWQHWGGITYGLQLKGKQ